jgi:hypothetical protein
MISSVPLAKRASKDDGGTGKANRGITEQDHHDGSAGMKDVRGILKT